MRPARIQRALALVALLFGLATIVAGTRVMAGSDPGYAVYRPLLLFNTAMGIAYIAAAALMWRSSRLGMYAAAAIFALNAVVLVAITMLPAAANTVAPESVRAMMFRTGVWLVLGLALMGVRRRELRG